MGAIPQIMSDSVEKYGLGYIRPRHNEIARRLVAGQMQTDICREMGYTDGRLSIIVNSPLFKMEVARLSKLRDDSVTDIIEELRELAPIAVSEVSKVMMTSPSEKLRLQASADILDRAGVVKKGATGGIHINVNTIPAPVNLDDYKPGGAKVIEIEAEVVSTDVQPLNTSKDTTEEDLKLIQNAMDTMAEIPEGQIGGIKEPLKIG